MPVPDYADPTPAYQQIARDLREQIRSGKLAPGDRLPSNRALSEHYGVAAETIRGALDVLRAEGLIATQGTRGTYVLREPAEQSGEFGAVMKRLDEMETELRRLKQWFGEHAREHQQGQ